MVIKYFHNMKHKTMLFRSGIILFYFSKWSYQIVNELVVKGTPRVGHPAKEGLRLPFFLREGGRATTPE